MTMLTCPYCGKVKSRRGGHFDQKRLKQHIQDVHLKDKKVDDGDPDFTLTDMIAGDDMPDGAYFALAHELGEW